MGEALLRAGKAGEAESEFKAELARNPFETAALLGTAEVQLLKGSALPALEPVSRVLNSAPDVLVLALSDFPEVDLPSGSAGKMTAELEAVAPSPGRDFLLSGLRRVSGDNQAASTARKALEQFVAAYNRKKQFLSRFACEQHREHLCADFLASLKQPAFSDLLRLGRADFVLHQDQPASDAFAAALAKSRTSPEATY